MWSDLRHAIRFVLANPGFSIAAAATLALGIGANSAMFTVVYEALLRPLPYERADELVRVWESYDGGRNVIAPANFIDWQRRSRSYAQLGRVRSRRRKPVRPRRGRTRAGRACLRRLLRHAQGRAHTRPVPSSSRRIGRRFRRAHSRIVLALALRRRLFGAGTRRSPSTGPRTRSWG